MKAMMEELAASGLSEEEILEKTQVSHAKFLQLNPDPVAKNLHLKMKWFSFF
jgi:3-methyladenine DNA glycosylase Tag